MKLYEVKLRVKGNGETWSMRVDADNTAQAIVRAGRALREHLGMCVAADLIDVTELEDA